MQNPPAGVKTVMEAVCIMKAMKPKKKDGDKPGQKIDDYWEPAKSELHFTDSLALVLTVRLNTGVKVKLNVKVTVTFVTMLYCRSAH